MCSVSTLGPKIVRLLRPKDIRRTAFPGYGDPGPCSCVRPGAVVGGFLPVWGTEGLQQGALFSLAFHRTLCRVVELHPGVFLIVYMDNAFIAGRLTCTLPPAATLAACMEDKLSLVVNVHQSLVHVPA